MADDGIYVSDADITTSGTAAEISSSALVNALIKQQGEALALLEQVAPVNLADLSVDATGKVVVANAAFAAAVTAKRGDEAKNSVCGLGCRTA